MIISFRTQNHLSFIFLQSVNISNNKTGKISEINTISVTRRVTYSIVHLLAQDFDSGPRSKQIIAGTILEKPVISPGSSTDIARVDLFYHMNGSTIQIFS